MRAWTRTRDADGYATLAFDKAGAAVNTLSAGAMAELAEALDALDATPPKGLVIRSAKASGFIAGADIDEFRAAKTPEDGLAIVRRGWELFERLANVRYPTLALVKGFCLGDEDVVAIAERVAAQRAEAWLANGAGAGETVVER